MSSDRSGAEHGTADDAAADDPWFAPGPKRAASPGNGETFADPDFGPFEASTTELNAGPGLVSSGEPNNGATDAAAGEPPVQGEWFLRTGRAGLNPDSVTDWAEESGDASDTHREHRVTSAGAPPWAGETTALSASNPPPWETGPWPGPGDPRSPAGLPASRSATASLTGTNAAAGSALNDAEPAGAPTRWPARTVLVAGLIPLVVPGLVLGALSLRQPGNEAVRKASWLAIGASIAWAVVLIVTVASVSGGQASSCNGYPAAVHQAYSKALADLSSNAPTSVQAADLGVAASLANASAAEAGHIGVRTALFTMANDMAQARADVVAQRPVPAALRQHLANDGTVPAGSCN